MMYVFAMSIDILYTNLYIWIYVWLWRKMDRKNKYSNIPTCIFVGTAPNVFEYLLRQLGTNEIFFGSLRQWGVAATRMKPLGGGAHWTLNSCTEQSLYSVRSLVKIWFLCQLFRILDFDGAYFWRPSQAKMNLYILVICAQRRRRCTLNTVHCTVILFSCAEQAGWTAPSCV